MTARQRTFCLRLIAGDEPSVAARKAGYSPITATRNAGALLAGKSVQAKLARHLAYQKNLNTLPTHLIERIQDYLLSATDAAQAVKASRELRQWYKTAQLPQFQQMLEHTEHLHDLQKIPTKSGI